MVDKMHIFAKEGNIEVEIFRDIHLSKKIRLTILNMKEGSSTTYYLEEK